MPLDLGTGREFSIRGRLMQTPTPDALEVTDDAVIQVGADGLIESITVDSSTAVDLDLGPGGILMPGLIDTHVHAPQWPQVGTGLDLGLERWLFEYTLPLERRYHDLEWAGSIWDRLAPAMLRAGTTTAVYYGTIDNDATTLLAERCVHHGQRALVGRVAMDHPDGTPEWYRDPSASAAVAASLESVERIRALGSDLVQPILTPRFAPACTDALLEGIGELAEATATTIQTHCSESDWEHGYAFERFGVSDTVALDRFGLLRDGTVLAHCGHAGGIDLALMRDRGAGIAHCPLSNAYFGDAVFAARRAISAGVHVGLGSDLAGGYHLGLFQQASQAVTSSRMLETGTDHERSSGDRGRSESSIDTVAAFWMATAGGASTIGHPTGVLEPGRPFDALAIDLEQSTHDVRSGLNWWPEIDDDRRTFEKIVNTAGATDIARVWVAGRPVVDPPPLRG